MREEMHGELHIRLRLEVKLGLKLGLRTQVRSRLGFMRRLRKVRRRTQVRSHQLIDCRHLGFFLRPIRLDLPQRNRVIR